MKEIEPRVATSRSGMITQRGMMSNLAMTRGRVRESLRLRNEQRERLAEAGVPALAKLSLGLDSVIATAVVLENPAAARAMLDRALQRAPVDSIPYLDRDYAQLLLAATLAGDTARARAFHADNRKAWESVGNLLDRPALEALDDANLARVLGRHDEEVAAAERASRLPSDRADGMALRLFLAYDRAQHVDSALAAGERYLAINNAFRLLFDAHFRAGVLQRLGEMYEAKGNIDKAITHYQAFVELWKDADPELQPRVRDLRGRIERLQRRRG
jgi:tetratricopeptide (TPR) repeat protein